MESDLPKIQIKKVAILQIISFFVFMFGIFVFSIITGILLASFIGNQNFLEVIAGTVFLGLMPIGFFFVFFVIFYPIGLWRLTTISYGFGKDVLTLRGGIIARYEKNLLFSKIQHVVITQSFWERMFGIANVAIQTAGGGEIFVQQRNGQNQQVMLNGPQIPALLKRDAEMLRDKIISRVSHFRGQGL